MNRNQLFSLSCSTALFIIFLLYAMPAEARFPASGPSPVIKMDQTTAPSTVPAIKQGMPAGIVPGSAQKSPMIATPVPQPPPRQGPPFIGPGQPGKLGSAPRPGSARQSIRPSDIRPSTAPRNEASCGESGCSADPSLSRKGLAAKDAKTSEVNSTTLGLGRDVDFVAVARAVSEMNAPVIVSPEIPVAVRLSASDVNRINCTAGEIKEVHFSREKGITVNISGKDAFLKYKYAKSGGKALYASNPTEIFIICADTVYNLIAVPESIPSQTIRLSSGDMDRIKKNRSIFSGMPSEKKILKLIQFAYKEELPDSFTIEKSSVPVHVYKNISVRLVRTVKAEGEGLRLKEFTVELPFGAKDEVELEEKDFLRTEFTNHTLAISMDKSIVKAGDPVRLFICELAREQADSASAAETTIRLDRNYVSPAAATNTEKTQKQQSASGTVRIK